MLRVVLATLAMLSATLLAACASGSSILVGTPRPAIDPGLVRIYTSPPRKYEEVAVIEASSRNSLAFGAQAQTDKVIERLKAAAAALGANGVLLDDLGKAGGATVGTGLGGASASGSGSGINVFGASIGLSTDLENRLAKGRAIYVVEE